MHSKFEIAEEILFSSKDVRKGVVGVKKPLSFICYKSFIICAKEINCFRVHLHVNLST